MIDAIRANADCFITENPVWTSVADEIGKEYSLLIVEPIDFIALAGSD